MRAVISIDLESDVPRYLQLAQALRALIASGELAAGDKIPSTHQLMTQTGLAQATVEKAFAVLRSEGLVRTVPGVGIFVRSA